MKTSKSLQSILAGIGVGSMLIYVLACSTSFSPDDRQILYPSYDPQSDSTCVALYDRKTGRSEIIYTAAELEQTTNQHPVLIRAEWMPDGKHILIGQTINNSGLYLTLLPRGIKEPVRQFLAEGADDTAASLEFPFAVVGNELWLNAEKTEPVQINLVTGKVAGGEKSTNPVVVLPSADGKSPIGLRGLDKGPMEFGTFDSQTKVFKPTVTLNEITDNDSLPTFSPKTGQIIFVSEDKEKGLTLKVFKGGTVKFSRDLKVDDKKLGVGPFLDLTPDGETVLAVYGALPRGQTNCEYGLLEIPLSKAPLRLTPLFHADTNEDIGLLFAQPSLSHDGKTWAIATSYLYRQNKSLTPEDSALFLVDLSKAKRPVTKVPIPVPPDRKKLL